MAKRPADDNRYFASLPSDEIGSALHERVESHKHYCTSSGRAALIRKASALVLGAHVESGAVAWGITEGGEQGEVLKSAENQFHSIGTNVVNRVCQQRPSVQLGATNSDKKSLSQTLIAGGLSDYHLSEQGLEKLLKKAAWKAWFLSEGFVEFQWDVHSGDDYGPDPDALMAQLSPELDEAGNPIDAAPVGPVPVRKKGEPKFYCLGPLEVIRDEYATSWENLSWLITIKWVSKFELAARYPELTEEIISLQTKDNEEFRISLGRREMSTDLIPFYSFYHRKTVAVPQGRLVEFLSDDVVLFDGPLAYDDIPLERIVPEEMDDSPFGWTPMTDLMGPQDAINGLDTAIVTNQLGRGIGNMVTDEDSNVSVEALSSSMNLIRKSRGSEISALEWPATPVEMFQFRQEKIGAMEVLAGTNSVLRGSPSDSVGSDSSGAKIRFIAETSAVNTSGFEKSWVDLIRQVVLRGVIRLYRDFGGNVPRLARIAGKANNYLLKEFTAEDLTDIDRVKVDVGNPVMRTIDGRMMVADKAVELGLIQEGQLDKYLHILNQGTAEPLFEVEQAQLMRIRGENEQLMEGGQHHALLTDPHWREIPEHLTLLDNPSIREPTPENQALQSAVLGAVTEHLSLFRAMPPELVFMRGGPDALAMWQQVMGIGATPPPGGPGGPPPPGGDAGPPPPGGPPSPETLPPEQPPSVPGNMGGPGMPRMPSMPAEMSQPAPGGAS